MDSQSHSISQYREYVDELKQVIEDTIHQKVSADNLDMHLDGYAGKFLRQQVPLDLRRKRGIFFTSSKLAGELVKMLPKRLKRNGVFLDPACGAGDLLLAIARRLPVEETLSATLANWNEQLYGFDLVEEFVEATKFRLILLALYLGAICDTDPSNSYLLSNIKVGDGLRNAESLLKADYILLNPPFSPVILEGKSWASGKTTEAAVFFDEVLRNAKRGARVYAILPDVLRSGSRYDRWRKHIGGIFANVKIKIFGLFDEDTDVDVFLLHGIVNKSSLPVDWYPKATFSIRTIGDISQVSVGTLVPFRDTNTGQPKYIVSAKLLPKWTTYRPQEPLQRTDAIGILPPFIVVRRTSRPGDSCRIVPTIIDGSSLVAVENHLIVIRPYSGKLSDCEHIMASFKNKLLCDYIDSRIRCRHLTTEIIKTLPIY